MHKISKGLCDIIDYSVELAVNKNVSNFKHSKTENIEMVHANFRTKKFKGAMEFPDLPTGMDFKITIIDNEDMIFSFGFDYCPRIYGNHVVGLCQKSQSFYDNNKLLVDELKALYRQNSKISIERVLYQKLQVFNARSFDLNKEALNVYEETKKHGQIISDYVALRKF